MTDRMTPEQRHRCMSRIRSTDTKPEMVVRKYLFARGYRYRLHVKRLPGRPDIVLKKYHTVIFVNGCFWHGHEGCKYYVIPKTRSDFWKAKIERNQERDKKDHDELKKMGWNILTIWECQLMPKVRQQTLKEVEYCINRSFLEIAAKKYSFGEEENLKVAEKGMMEYGTSDK